MHPALQFLCWTGGGLCILYAVLAVYLFVRYRGMDADERNSDKDGGGK